MLRMKLRLLPLVLAFACTPADEEETATTDTDASESDPDTSAGTNDTNDPALACAIPEEQDSTDGAMMSTQQTWGAACNTDADCVALVGEGGVCLTQAVVYELPYGYCAKPCQLPDMATRVVMDDPMCDPAGGVACTGQMGIFEYCGVLCTDDAQCDRDGYICRQMPMIAQPEDPTLCLMPDCCLDDCTE
jgi:hypothetical protein